MDWDAEINKLIRKPRKPRNFTPSLAKIDVVAERESLPIGSWLGLYSDYEPKKYVAVIESKCGK